MIKTSKSRFSLCLSLGTLLLTLVLGYSTSASGQLTLNASFNAGVTDGNSQASVTAVQSDGKVLVGGNFAFANSAEKFGLVRLNSDGSLDSTFNLGGSGPNGPILDIKLLPTAKVLIAGGFTTYNGTSIQGICRLNSDGTLDTTFNIGGVGVSGGVNSIVMQADGKILISGNGINAYNGTTKFSVVRINADGTLDTGFTSPFVSGQFVEQPSLQSDGKIVIGGTFSIGGYNNLARLNTNGSLDATFNAGGSGPDGGVFAVLVVAGDKILAGGKYFNYNGAARPSFARLNSDGSLDTGFIPPTVDFDASVEYFATNAAGKYLVAGLFDTSTGQFPVILVNTDGTLDATFTQPQADNEGYQVTVQGDGKILLAGLFNNVEVLGGLTHRNLVRLNANGTTDSAFATTFNTFATAAAFLQQTNGKYIVAGNFNLANGVDHRNIARFNSDGSVDNTFQSGYGLFNSGTISAVALAQQSDGKILLGGSFDSYNLDDAPGLVRLNTDGSKDSSFAAFGLTSGVSSVNDILVQPDGKILVAGTGLADGSKSLIRLNSDGSIDPAFTISSVNGAGQKILRQSDGKLILFGNFNQYSTTHNRLVRLAADGSVDGTFNIGTGANGTIFTAAFQPDGKIVIGGGFTSFNGTTRNRIARLNADGTLDNSFDPAGGPNSNVNSIAVQPDGKLVICGAFTSYGGVNRYRLARVSSSGTLDMSSDSGVANDFRFGIRRLMLTNDNGILVGGTFTNYAGAAKNSIAKLRTSSGAPFDFDGDGKTDIGIIRLNGGVSEWWLSRSSDSNVFATVFGLTSDIPAPGDFTGDGKTDITMFRPSTGQWFVLRSEDFSFFAFPFGANGDIPVPADYDGDGKTDPAVFRPSTNTWFISRTSDGQTTIAQFGAAGDKPIPADYDGDGKADIAVYRANNGAQEWWIQRSTAGLFATVFGIAGDKAVAGDYTGDGKTDIAVWRPSNGNWFVLRSEDFSFFAFPWGANGDIPAPGDYDGDGKTDAAVFRQSASTWFINRTGGQGPLISNFGAATDSPVAGVFVR